MELLFYPPIWAGFFTLIVLEIILGIDNLVFIAIITDKLIAKQQYKARLIGLSFALVMRVGLLSLMSWIVTLRQPLFKVGNFSCSGRDLILLIGGIFLLFKAITELHERLENHDIEHHRNKNCSNFWLVVIQIIVLDAIFSLDAIITAVGMVNQLPIMIAAVVIAMSIMLLASNSLTQFINSHPTVVVLCLSFLLMIGLSLIAEGLGFNVPKGYLYASIGFSIIIELFNQIARRNFLRQQARRPMRERTAEVILRLMDGCQRNHSISTKDSMLIKMFPKETFKHDERDIINGVVTLSQLSINSIMTPRDNIVWINASKSVDEIKIQLLNTSYNFLPVCCDTLDNIIGVVQAKNLLIAVEDGFNIMQFAAKSPAVMVPETLDSIMLLSILRNAKVNLIIVNNDVGLIRGLISPSDVLKAIIGKFDHINNTT
ncbi:hypothetical protein FD727_00640 [Pantoea sp. Mhis]|nr:hypothetical protein [Pantoea sp. Mhis]